MDELKVTSIEELKKQSTQVIQIENFSGEGHINVRVRRMSLFGLCKKGQIPNQLLGKARELFYGSNKIDSMDLKSMGELFDIVCSNILIEPSMKQLEDEQISLTDTQKLQLWSYSQEGIDGLKSFRKVAKDAERYIDSKKLQNKTKPSFKHNK